MSVPEMSLHKKVFQIRKMSIKNERPKKGKGGSTSPHTDSFRIQVALEYIDGPYSYAQIGRKYGVTEVSVRTFVYWYKKNHVTVMTEEQPEQEQPSSGSQDQKALEKKLALAEMKIAALEKVIAIANVEYGTDLKKKAATK